MRKYVASLSRRYPSDMASNETGSSHHIHRGDVLGRIAPVRFVNQARSFFEILFSARIGPGRRGMLASPHAVLVLKPLRGVQFLCSYSPISQEGGNSTIF